MQHNNPFRTLTKDEELEIQAKKDARDKALESAIQAARKVLNHEVFKDYRDNYERMLDKNIDILLDLPFVSIEDWAVKAKELVDEIRFFRTIIKDVENKARTGYARRSIEA